MTSLELLFQASLKRFSRLLFNSNYIDILFCHSFLLILIRDVCSRAASVEVPVYLTGKTIFFKLVCTTLDDEVRCEVRSGTNCMTLKKTQ